MFAVLMAPRAFHMPVRLLRRENVCPQCRKPMQSRRDCRPDPRFDHLVSVLYNDVSKYEEQVIEQN